MPDEDKPLPEDIEIEISRLASEAAAKLLKKDQRDGARRGHEAANKIRLRKSSSVNSR